MTPRNLGIAATLIFLSALVWNVQAQTPPIEVITDNDRVLFSTQGQTHTMHVEVFSPSGEVIFERASASEEAVVWPMVNDKEERVADGVYLAIITVTDSTGKRRKRIEQIVVSRATQPKELSAAASISPAARDDFRSVRFSSARMQAVSFKGKSVFPIQPLNAGNAISESDAKTRLDLSSPSLSLQGANNTFYGVRAGQANTSGSSNSFFGTEAGFSNLGGGGNTFIGFLAGDRNTSGSNNTFIGNNADGFSPLNNATAIGANAYVAQDNSLVLGSIWGSNSAAADTNVGIGTSTPRSRLHIGRGYLQLPFVTVAPAASDCTALTAGRMVVFANGSGAAQLYICDTSSVAGNQVAGWVIK